MKNNTQSNNIIKLTIVAGDFLILNALLAGMTEFHPWFAHWTPYRIRTLILLSNLALVISEYFNSPIIQERVVSVADILKRIMRLALGHSLFSVFFMRSLAREFVGGKFHLTFFLLFLVTLLFARVVERQFVKYYRRSGNNMRRVTFVGADPELLNVYTKLNDVATKGYKILGYYADDEMVNMPEGVEIKKLGTIKDLLANMQSGNLVDEFGDEIYVCLSRLRRDVIRKISSYCDQKMVRFYYVPVSVETLGIDLKRELLDDMEIFTTYENPLMNPVNKVLKRAMDLLLAMLFMIPTLIIFPIVWLIIKIQSPGPIFFKQKRTGLDGKEFDMLKFRSMHVNADADKVQATKDDPRKYPFGNFMRKANIDEVPQIFNILKGDMSVVGPRPHMLAHTEQYSQLIDKYMVRHFVKPGVTGWAQVTGFRGETSELWQMEGRVKRDIWYMEHWSIWLDIRIIWMTLKTFFVHDKNAY